MTVSSNPPLTLVITAVLKTLVVPATGTAPEGVLIDTVNCFKVAADAGGPDAAHIARAASNAYRGLLIPPKRKPDMCPPLT